MWGTDTSTLSGAIAPNENGCPGDRAAIHIRVKRPVQGIEGLNDLPGAPDEPRDLPRYVGEASDEL